MRVVALNRLGPTVSDLASHDSVELPSCNGRSDSIAGGGPVQRMTARQQSASGRLGSRAFGAEHRTRNEKATRDEWRDTKRKTESYFGTLRRIAPIPPIRPVPSSIRLEGSGVVIGAGRVAHPFHFGFACDSQTKGAPTLPPQQQNRVAGDPGLACCSRGWDSRMCATPVSPYLFETQTQ